MRFKLLRLLGNFKNLKSLKNLKNLKSLNIGNLNNLKNFKVKNLKIKNFNNLKIKNFNNLKIKNLKNLKNLIILLLLNLIIVLAIYYPFNNKFRAINALELAPKINQQRILIDDLKNQLVKLSKHNQTVNKFKLGKQTRLLKIIISAFENIKINAFKANNKGLVYVISGDSTAIMLLAYKINKAISSNMLKAQVKSVLLNNSGAVLKVQVFGLGVDD